MFFTARPALSTREKRPPLIFLYYIGFHCKYTRPRNGPDLGSRGGSGGGGGGGDGERLSWGG